MATKTIGLSSIPQNWFMTWTMSTQAANNICVTLADSKTTYVSNQCRANKTFGNLAQGFQQVAGTGMQLTITVANATTLNTITSGYQVMLGDGTVVGQGVNILLEDSNDNDYNDLFVSILAWQSQG
jgi:hypothetical protein